MHGADAVEGEGRFEEDHTKSTRVQLAMIYCVHVMCT